MKIFIFTAVLSVMTAALIFFSCRLKAPAPEKATAHTLLVQIDEFAAVCARLQAEARSLHPDNSKLHHIFIQARLAYKKFEWAAEYFVPATSKLVNGPPVQEVERSGRVIAPAGLQVIEGLLFPAYQPQNKSEVIQQLAMLPAACDKLKTYFGNIDILDGQVFDAVKLEVFRIITVGIAGFDTPLCENSLAECATSLNSIKGIMTHYTAEADGDSLQQKLSAAQAYITTNTDFNSFNRMEFIKAYCNPVTICLTNLEKKLNVNVITYNRLLNQDANTLFDANAFNVNAYAPDPGSFSTPAKVALGKMLFSDPVLSGNGTRSCRSCHQPGKAFTDGIIKNTIVDNHTLLKRNTPTLLNAALQPSLFYDLRLNRLEEQARNVVQSREEMHGSLRVSVKRLWENDTYRKLFSAAFPKKDRLGIDTLEVVNAISSFIRSLVLLNSRFDEYMRGNSLAMNSAEINGFNLFMGKAKCGTCHYMPLFNGTFPPRYMKIESEVIGVPQSLGKNIIDSDMGRFDVVKIPSLKHSFKTSTIRNAALTAPYMHNGVFAKLEQVIDFYDKGGGAGMGIKIANQTLPAVPLNLTAKERNELIEFIKSLNSR